MTLSSTEAKKKETIKEKSCNAELLSCQPDSHPSSGFMAGLLQTGRARSNRVQSFCRNTSCLGLKQRVQTSPGLTFMTSTCRSSWREGVTLMASNIWLSSCFSRTSTSMVTPPTNLSSHRSFWLEKKKDILPLHFINFPMIHIVHCILYSMVLKMLLFAEHGAGAVSLCPISLFFSVCNQPKSWWDCLCGRWLRANDEFYNTAQQHCKQNSQLSDSVMSVTALSVWDLLAW